MDAVLKSKHAPKDPVLLPFVLSLDLEIWLVRNPAERSYDLTQTLALNDQSTGTIDLGCLHLILLADHFRIYCTFSAWCL